MLRFIIFKFSKFEHLIFFLFFEVLNFEKSLIFQIEQFRMFDNFLNQSVIAIWKMADFPN